MNSSNNILSVAVISPVYNEGELLKLFIREVEQVLADFKLSFFIIDDGSEDNTIDIFKNLEKPKYNSKRELISLSRNFGHASAIFAGLNHMQDEFDVYIVIDADLQDNPTDIPSLIKEVVDGADCAYAVRKPNAQNVFRNIGTHLFYTVQRFFSPLNIPSYAGNFCAFNSKFKVNLIKFSETEFFFPGLRAYIGFRQVPVPVERSKRAKGNSKMSMRRLMTLAYLGLIGFSSAPMRLIFVFGFFNMIFFLIIFFILGVQHFFNKIEISLSLLVLLLVFFTNALQAIFIGILGEYLGKVFTETKRRPGWIINKVTRLDE